MRRADSGQCRGCSGRIRFPSDQVLDGQTAATGLLALRKRPLLGPTLTQRLPSLGPIPLSEASLNTHKTANMGKVHGSLARAGKVKGQQPKVEKQEKPKQPKGRAHKRLLYNR